MDPTTATARPIHHAKYVFLSAAAAPATRAALMAAVLPGVRNGVNHALVHLV